MTPTANKTIHITGGCGYVGSRVARALTDKGYQVVVIDKATPEERHADLPVGVEYRKANLTEPVAALEALKDAKAVIHLAANIGPVNYMWERQGEILWENNAIDAATYPALRDGGCELAPSSSSSMGFQNAPHYPYTEADIKETPAPTNVYGFSKLGGEYFCRSFMKQYGHPHFVIVRFHNIYGPGEDSKGSTPGDIYVIPALLEKVLRGQYPLEFIGNPEATRPFTYVDDAVAAVVALFEAALAGDGKVLDDDFNIATPEAMKILDLGAYIWERYGDGRPFEWKATETDASKTTSYRREADVSKLMKAVGWKPRTSFDEGLAKTAEWVKGKIK